MSRPDITAAMRNRKEKAILAVKQKKNHIKTILTNCPSCIQGIGRHSRHKIVARHIAHELALQIGHQNWENELRALAKNAEAIGF